MDNDVVGYDSMPDGGPGQLAVVLSICGTDRVDVTDRDLVDDLREKKGTYSSILPPYLYISVPLSFFVLA